MSKEEQPENICAFYLDKKGDVHWITNSIYNTDTQTLSFTINQFSTFGVGYRQQSRIYKDIENHHAKNDILFMVNKGLYFETTKTLLYPDSGVSRSFIITALGKLSDIQVDTKNKSTFTDVKTNAYYNGYVQWAVESHILESINDTSYLPNTYITKEQLSNILVSYANVIGFELPKNYDEIDFADDKFIDDNAKEAVKQLQMAGIFIGKSDENFEPKSIVTRAELSVYLRKFIELYNKRSTI